MSNPHRQKTREVPLKLLAVLVCGMFWQLPTARAQTGKPDGTRPRQAAGDRPSAKKTPAGTTSAPAKTTGRGDWSEPAGGVRLRAVAVGPETDEQKPDFLKALLASEYPSARDVTLLVEIQNVSDKPISLQGTRYGDSVTPPWPGKSVSDTFAPYLFDCEILEKTGEAIDRPSRTMLDGDAMMSLSSGQAETIEPKKSLVVLIRPLGWDAALAAAVGVGEFTVRVRYRGPTAGVAKEIQRVWPEKSLAKVWMGNVASDPIPFRIAKSKQKAPDLVWGDAVDGLEAAIELRHPQQTPPAARNAAATTFAHGTQVDVRVHVRNAGEKEISFWSETWRQDDKFVLIGEDGSEKPLGHSWYSGWARVEHWTLKPGQVAILSAISLAVTADKGAEKLEHPVGPTIIGDAGQYQLRMDLQFGNWKRESPGGKTIPGEDDWKGSLSTGIAKITVRERLPEDEPPTMTARLAFQSADGKPIPAGEVTVRRPSGKELAKGEFQAGLFEVPHCPFETLRVDVRAPGFEETVFHDVSVKIDQPTPLTLTAADPLRFRLVARDRRPVPDADVRYFLRSKADASAGPYPMHGTKGPTWGWSDKQGAVVLDTLQKFDPLDNKLGNNIYWFYVEPAGLAPLFIGPVEAGQELGDVEVSPLLDVTGEIHGTPAELAAFAAEWDQPVPMLRGNGKVGWHYAVSQNLETQRNGEVLVFHLTGLSAGKLRIVSRFKSGSKPVSHVYTRREPNEDDVVFEVDLTESRDDLVVKNRK